MRRVRRAGARRAVVRVLLEPVREFDRVPRAARDPADPAVVDRRPVRAELLVVRARVRDAVELPDLPAMPPA
ncbi:hypothetical protein [Skermania piniformis]|uniref:hypothetical protein n=1 Tax=Skermania pinensis TaxID=39122 RepID=UPI00082973CF|nr:hypothetical protein [Skermania piniformis]